MAYSMPQQITQHNYMLQQRAIEASKMRQPLGALAGLSSGKNTTTKITYKHV